VDAYTNLGFGRVLVRPEPPESGTSLQLLPDQGAKMPAVPFNATVWPTTDYPDPVNAEIVRVTAIVGDVLTIVRAQEGTAAIGIVEGFAFAQSITKKTIDDLRNASNINAGTLGDQYLSPNVMLVSTYVPPVIPPASQAFPIGSIFLSVVATSPVTMLGYGAWVAFGQGRMLVGLSPGDPDFATAEQIGGEKAVVLTEAQLAVHSHVQNAHGHTLTDLTHTHGQDQHGHTTFETQHSHPAYDTGHKHALSRGDQSETVQGSGYVASGTSPMETDTGYGIIGTSPAYTGVSVNPGTVNIHFASARVSVENATATNQNAGLSHGHNNLPPYIAVYMWKRVA